MNSAAERWKAQVEAHHDQSERARNEDLLQDDFWRPYASSFRVDPSRTDDQALERVANMVPPDATVLDVGGGAGRFALPLARRCRHVTVVEPSESMVAELRAAADDAQIGNLTVVQTRWEETDVEPAEVVLCAHVMYGVADVAPFVRKLQARARTLLIILMFFDSPQSHLGPFWKMVHGEQRIELPALPDLLSVLWEMGTYPDLEMVVSGNVKVYASSEVAIEGLRRRLYVSPGTPKDIRLQAAVRALLVETADGLAMRQGAEPRRQGIVYWRPPSEESI